MAAACVFDGLARLPLAALVLPRLAKWEPDTWFGKGSFIRGPFKLLLPVLALREALKKGNGETAL